MADIVKQILARPIQLADQVTKTADDASSFKQECAELKAKTEKLAGLLRQAARASSDLYERPTRRIMDDTEAVLDKALDLVIKCRGHSFVKRIFTIIPAAAFRKMSSQLENSIGDVSWLLRVSVPADDRDDEYLGLPPIAANEPILCLIWEQIAILCTGSLEDRSDAAASLVSLARDNDRYGKLIVEEGGVPPLLKLAKEGKTEGQENAARAIGLLGRDGESVEEIVHAGVCPVFAKLLKDGNMKVQAMVAWGVSELAENYPKCQDLFAQSNVIRMLVSHLAFETIQEHSKYAIAATKQHGGLSIHSVILASKDNPTTSSSVSSSGGGGKQQLDQEYGHVQTRITRPMESENQNQMHNVVASTMAIRAQSTKPPNFNPSSSSSDCTSSTSAASSSISMINNTTTNHSTNPSQHSNNHNNRSTCSSPQHHQNHMNLAGTSIKGKEFEDPATKANMKAMAARALWKLAKGNNAVCYSITESRALLCFAVLLEKGPDEVQYNSAMALAEITAVAEHNAELRRSAFKPNSPSAKAVFEQLLRIIEAADSDLLVPCVQSLGSLARTFRATETRIIGPLVRLLDERDPDVSREAVVALIKFACTENFLHMNHAKAIIKEGGAKHLIQLVYFSEHMVQVPSAILLCYVALHVPDSEALAKEEVLIVLEWASKQAHLAQNPLVESLLPEAKSRLELYQSRGSRGFH